MRARALVCLCATLRVRFCASASDGLTVCFKAEPLVWRWSVMMRTSVMCPAVIWLDIKIRVTTVATSYLNIGAVYGTQGRYEEALFQFQKALEVFLLTL